MKTYKKYMPFTLVQDPTYWTSTVLDAEDLANNVDNGSWWSHDLMPEYSNTSFSLFVGNNIDTNRGLITRTLDAGATFEDVVLDDANSIDVEFTDVAIYDANCALVTGRRTTTGEGVLLATYNRGTTWHAPDAILNDSGVANVLTSSASTSADHPRRLVSMTQVSDNDFLVIREDVPYTQPDSSNNFGMCNVFHGHWPQLFHRNQRILDISGSVQITGSMSIEDDLNVGGKITCPVTTIQSDYRVKTNVVSLCEVHPPSSCTVDELRPVQYFNTLTGRTDIGFLAHELAEQFPFLVHGEKDDTEAFQSINYTGLIGLLVQEIQDLKTR
jgi:hypothetical protein